MSYGLGSAGARTNKAAGAGPPPAVTSADDGLSVTAAKIRLGQTVGAVGNPAILLENREIPMGGFSLDYKGSNVNLIIDDSAQNLIFKNGGTEFFRVDPFNNTYLLGDYFNNNVIYFDPRVASRLFTVSMGGGNRYLALDVPAGHYQIGDINNSQSGSNVLINDANRKLQYFDKFGHYLTLDQLSGSYQLGDIDTTLNGNKLFVDDTNNQMGFKQGADWYLRIINTGISKDYELGDISASNNGFRLLVDDTNSVIEFLSTAGSFFELDIIPGIYKMGDLSGLNNHGRIILDDGSKSFEYQSGFPTSRYLILDVANQRYQIGDVDATGNASNISINDSNKRVDIIGNGNDSNLSQGISLDGSAGQTDLISSGPAINVVFTLDGTAQQIEATVGNGVNKGFKITGDHAFLLHTGQAMDDGAAGNLATLANAPKNGDPDKWIAIDDFGTTRYIPTWTVGP
jgi:hypothetical protein